jgi:hypothetical protein
MAIVYASTTRSWFDALATLLPAQVAFWQPTPARPSRIQPGERWYFKELGAEKKRIDQEYQSTLKAIPDQPQKKVDPWAKIRSPAPAQK